jgi:hypothetical protein
VLHQALKQDQRRRFAVDASSGKYADAFTATQLDELHNDWPA